MSTNDLAKPHGDVIMGAPVLIRQAESGVILDNDCLFVDVVPDAQPHGVFAGQHPGAG